MRDGLPKLICATCDGADGAKPEGDINDGGDFGSMGKEQVRFTKTRNSQLSAYAGSIREVTNAYERCKNIVDQLQFRRFITQEQLKDFAHVFNLANMGRYYAILQLKETADILVDAGLAKPNEDVWNLGMGEKKDDENDKLST